MSAHCQQVMCSKGLGNRTDFRRWAVRGGHPDKGGNTSVFQAVNNCVEDNQFCAPQSPAEQINSLAVDILKGGQTAPQTRKKGAVRTLRNSLPKALRSTQALLRAAPRHNPQLLGREAPEGPEGPEAPEAKSLTNATPNILRLGPPAAEQSLNPPRLGSPITKPSQRNILHLGPPVAVSSPAPLQLGPPPPGTVQSASAASAASASPITLPVPTEVLKVMQLFLNKSKEELEQVKIPTLPTSLIQKYRPLIREFDTLKSQSLVLLSKLKAAPDPGTARNTIEALGKLQNDVQVFEKNLPSRDLLKLERTINQILDERAEVLARLGALNPTQETSPFLQRWQELNEELKIGAITGQLNKVLLNTSANRTQKTQAQQTLAQLEAVPTKGFTALITLWRQKRAQILGQEKEIAFAQLIANLPSDTSSVLATLGFKTQTRTGPITIQSTPSVLFFTRDPPIFPAEGSAQLIQEAVASELGEFRWPVITIPDQSPCPAQSTPQHGLDDEALESKKAPVWQRRGHATKAVPTAKAVLNDAQKISYHYMQPFNGNRNVVLVHSAGSGKSCTAGIIASLFGRDGYTVLIVTKNESLAQEIPNAQILHGCDMNLQQFMNGRPIGKALVEEGYLTSADLTDDPSKAPGLIVEAAKQVLRDMQVHQNFDFFTYPQLQNMASPTMPKKLERYLRGQKSKRQEGGLNVKTMQLLFGPPGLKEKPGLSLIQRTQLKRKEVALLTGDPFYKVMIVIDEAHKLTAANPTDIVGWNGNIGMAEIRQMCWRSDKASEHPQHGHPLRRLALTATPADEHVIDLINLATMMKPQDEIDASLLGYGKTNGKAAKDKSMDQFMREHVAEEDGKLRAGSREALSALFAGTFSYLNYTGDVARFAQPSIHYHNVPLSTVQSQSILGALRLPRKIPSEQGERLAQALPEWVEYQDGQLKAKETIPPQFKPGKMQDADKKAKKTEQLIAAYTSWPAATLGPERAPTKTGKPRGRGPGQLTSAVLRNPPSDNATLSEASPLMLAVVENIIRIQRETAARAAREPGVPRGQKQFVYIDSNMGGQQKNNYGVFMLQKLLELRGYTVVNDCGTRGPQEANPYRGMIVVGHDNRRKSPVLIKQFNKPGNVNGRQAALILADSGVKEGVSFKNVGTVHIAGFIKSRADLIQAVARAFRNCKHDGNAYVPGQGWQVNVEIYSPTFPGTQIHPLELLWMLNPATERGLKVQEEVEGIMQASAYDRLLLENINAASAKTLEGLQLWPPAPVSARQGGGRLGWLLNKFRPWRSGTRKASTASTAPTAPTAPKTGQDPDLTRNQQIRRVLEAGF